MGKYDDIRYIKYEGSKTRKRMSLYDRAAQFAPFDALTGYKDEIIESARLTSQKIELSEDQKTILDFKMQNIVLNQDVVTLTYVVKDKKKEGGEYISYSDRIRKIDIVERVIITFNKKRIPIDDIIEINL